MDHMEVVGEWLAGGLGGIGGDVEGLSGECGYEVGGVGLRGRQLGPDMVWRICCSRGRCGHGCVQDVGKIVFVKNNVTGHDDAPRLEIVIAITLMFKGITEKKAVGGAWGEFVVSGRIEVGVAETTKYVKVIIGLVDAV